MYIKQKYPSPNSPYLLEFLNTGRKSLIKQMTDKSISLIVNKIALRAIDKKIRKDVDFRVVQTMAEWQESLAFRLDNYRKTLPYILNELNEDGSDPYDNHSLVFGIWYKKELVASIRYTTWPFEVINLLDQEKLEPILSGDECHNYLELSRLLIKPNLQSKGILPGLLLFSGLTVCTKTKYTKYTGYTKKAVFKKLARFKCHSTAREFKLDNRGEHTYVVLDGNFRHDFVNTINNALPIKLGSLFSKLFFSR